MLAEIRVENDDLTHCCLLQIHLSQNLDLQKLVENQNELNPHPRLIKKHEKESKDTTKALVFFPEDRTEGVLHIARLGVKSLRTDHVPGNLPQKWGCSMLSQNVPR